MCSLSLWNMKNSTAFICSRCERINLLELFSEERSVLEKGQCNILLEHQNLDDLDPQCNFCCLLRVAWPDPELKPPHHLTVQSLKDRGLRYHIHDGKYRDPADGHLIHPDPIRWLRISGKNPQWIEAADFDISNCITEASTTSLLDTRIDFRLLKSWIKHCCDNHLDECGTWDDWKLVKGMNLIDVRNRSVVKATNHQFKYAALSYVWGIQMVDDESSDGLPAQLPRTIEDAFQATRDLGLDYLWVDKYCIPQRNEEDKNDQIRNMDGIYQQAHVTIVAAAGNGPDHGLPGVSLPRAFPAHILIEDRLFVGLPAHPLRGGAIQQSRWNTRAWTYQEKFFSRRILYFTDSQVVFNCKQNSTGIEDPVRNYAHSEVRHLIDDDGYDQRHSPGAGLFFTRTELNHHIRTVNGRQITYETDRINTLAGIFNHLEAEDIITGHLSGIPILRHHDGRLISWESGFLSGLAWSMDDSEGRRNEFPSWSWAGWKGSYRTSRPVLGENVHIRFEIQPDDSTAPILVDLGSQDWVLNKRYCENFPRTHNQTKHTVASLGRLRGREELRPRTGFLPVLERAGWKDSSCRFIHIEAPVVHFRCKKVDGHWQIASLEGYPIHEDTTIVVDILVPEEPQLEEAFASKTFRGLVLFEKDWDDVFIIVLRDFAYHSERIGNWEARKNLFILPELRNKNGLKAPLRVRWYDLVSRDDFEEITGGRRERVRLG